MKSNKRAILSAIVLLISLISFPATGVPVQADSARYEFEYRINIPEWPVGAKKFRLWIPYPLEDRYQKIIKSDIRISLPWKMEKEAKYQNRIIYVEGNVGKAPIELKLVYQIERKVSKGYPPAASDKHSPWVDSLPSRLIPFTPQFQRIAKEETKGLTKPLAKIRSLYDYIYRTMTYNKDGKGWGRGDPVWACSRKRGNCTDFHSLFIALARTQGIPARFEMGVPIPQNMESGEIPGYHCWASAYDESRGWIPLDASEAKKAGDPDAYFGTLPNNRIQFSVGRDLVLSPPQDGEKINYFIYPHAEVDGKQFAGLETKFSFKRLE